MIDDLARIEELKRYKLLDTAPQRDLDALTKLAAVIAETPMALISLVEAERQWFKSKLGFDDDETPREHAFCNVAIQTPEKPLVVENALEDDRFKNNPFVVGDPNIRFYAGVPLVTPNGYALGTLCVLDKEPRTLTKAQETALKLLADRVLTIFERRKNFLYSRKMQESIGAKLALAAKQTSDVILMVNDAYEVQFANRAINGFAPEDLLGMPLSRIVLPADVHDLEEDIKTVFAQNEQREVKARFEHDQNQWFNVHVIPVEQDDHYGLVALYFADITRQQKEFDNSEKQRMNLEAAVFLMMHQLSKPADEIIQASRLDEDPENALQRIHHAAVKLKLAMLNLMQLYKRE